MPTRELTLGLLVVVSAGIVLLLAGVALLLRTTSRATSRLHSYSEEMDRYSDFDDGDDSMRRRSDAWLARRGLGAGIARMLAQADVKLSVTEYLLLHVALAGIGFFAAYYLLNRLVLAAGIALVLLLIPQVYVSSARAKRLRLFSEQLPNALVSLANALRGGYGIIQAMSLTAEEQLPPASTEFRRVVAEAGYGLPYDVAFQNMLRRNPSEDLSLVVTAMELHMEMGGNLSEILDNIAAIIRDRVRIQGQIRTLTAQQRLSALILTALPFVVVGALYVVNPSYISLLWLTPDGQIILALSLVLLGAGTIVIRRVSTIKV